MVLAARIKARRRLLGATLLLMVGLVVIPSLFDSQPRPLPSDLPFTLASSVPNGPSEKHGTNASLSAPGLVQPAVPPQQVVEPDPSGKSRAPAGPAPTETQAQAFASESADTVAPIAPPPAASTATSKPAKLPPASVAQVPHAPEKASVNPPLAKPEPGTVAAAATPDGESRFIVQIGAFSEAASAKEVRAKVELSGLKTYTQVVDTPAGKRIRVRVGPYSSRIEAEKALQKLKSNGLNPVVLTL